MDRRHAEIKRRLATCCFLDADNADLADFRHSLFGESRVERASGPDAPSAPSCPHAPIFRYKKDFHAASGPSLPPKGAKVKQYERGKGEFRKEKKGKGEEGKVTHPSLSKR